MATAPEVPAAPGPAPSTDLVASLPSPLLRLLIIFARPISFLRSAIEVLAWQADRRVESYLVVLGWWALCLGFADAFTYLFPLLVFVPFVPLERLRIGPRKVVRSTPTQKQPATQDTLLRTLADLHKIQALLPPSAEAPVAAVYEQLGTLGKRRLVRGLVVSWAVWLVLGFVLGPRALLAITGTMLLLLPSPPMAHVVHLLSRSFAVRRVSALVFLCAFGSPEQATVLSSPIVWLRSKWALTKQPHEAIGFEALKVGDDEDVHAPADRAGNPIYFKFELHENQRWWMGLDWTSALLPQERPSWCDGHLLPVSPPVAFQLPPPSSIDLPAPTQNDPNGMVRRTATWRWLDDDWSVVRKSGKEEAISPVSSRPASAVFATGDDTSSVRAPSVVEQTLQKSLGKLKGVSIPGANPTSPIKATGEPRGRKGSESTDVSDDGHHSSSEVTGTIPPVDAETDSEGWVYGDNKWENMKASGGLGKFTRRRRWQRRAVCTETVHRISEPEKLLCAEGGSGAATPVPPKRELSRQLSGGSSAVSTAVAPKATPVVAPAPSATGSDFGRRSVDLPRGVPVTAPKPEASSLINDSTSRDDQLRQRLKKAMGSMGA